MAEEQAAGTQEQPQQQFAMQRIYTKDISLESPATPDVFKKQWQPQVSVDLGTKSNKIDEGGNYEVVLTLTITGRHIFDHRFQPRGPAPRGRHRST